MNLTDEQIKNATGLSQAQLDEEKIRQAAVKQANATPLPGASAAAFKINPSIKVGDYEVRPFFDCDFEFLQDLNHPLHRMVLGDGNAEGFLPRGQDAWTLCWMFTRSPDDVEDRIKVGLEFVRSDAKKEFSRKQLAELVAITGAVFKQLEAYWAPVLGYEADSEDGTKKNLSSDQPAKSPTASAG